MDLWIDTDAGFDDLLALLIVAHTGTPVDGISLVFGNSTIDHVAENAASAVAAFGLGAPVYIGRAASVLGTAETAQRVLGDSGILSSGPPLPPGPHPTGDAFSALCDWLSGPGPHTVLALGPLTNIAALALARPDLAARITSLVWMGGGVTAGNHTASAEFNAFADPEAVAIVLGHRLPLKMVDLDLCRQVTATPADVAPVLGAGGPNAEALAGMFGAFIDIAISRGRHEMALYDAAAAIAVVRPDLVTFTPAHIAMELAGTHTRGRTVVDRRTPANANAEVATAIDAPAARALVLAALEAAAR
ncbi:nucleoside hydrolase [Acuticoccus sp. MNP-M23]|uniref:nucleoside hydrolase n=1 Tax=Acuticoccus sp. MNP-M23 TaxID=3072793 RepID=UPI0028167C9A|nr:nucleoside hydrolase [Acuticoccus sp. MNP-M23]WMS43019.1 nucleoside hydrolase [Acuticoccus sp. MNP-M23]